MSQAKSSFLKTLTKRLLTNGGLGVIRKVAAYLTVLSVQIGCRAAVSSPLDISSTETS